MENLECVICLNQIEGGDVAKPLHCNCDVPMHKLCRSQMMDYDLLCPICRIKKSQINLVPRQNNRIPVDNINAMWYQESFLIHLLQFSYDYMKRKQNIYSFILFFFMCLFFSIIMLPKIFILAINDRNETII